MSLEKAVELVASLLIHQTYTELQGAEEALREQGIDIRDDFVLTDQRRRVLANIQSQFTNVNAPTVILTGWFGSGKTALLNQIIKDFAAGKLLYGARRLDSILIQLNVQNTLSQFLAEVVGKIADLTGEDWVVEQYRNAWKFIDLPNVTPEDARGLVETLVQMPPIRMAEVAQFLDELFRQYKRSTHGDRILALIIDELENLTRKGKLEGEDKLVELLKVLIDNAVRQYIDTLAVSRDPWVVVVFSITSRHELAKTGWFPQDTRERMESVEYEANLTPQSAEQLMKRMLRIYSTRVVDSLAQASTDGRLHRWRNQLSSAPSIDDLYYTYPVMPEVHHFFVSRLLKLTPDRHVLTFRAYQVGMHTLLRSWQGEQPIDLRYVVAQYDQLANELKNYPDGVILDNLIGFERIRSFIDRKCRPLKEGPRFQLSRITNQAITRGATPVVSITLGHLEQWLPEAPTEAAFKKLLESVGSLGLDEWDVTGDTINVNVQTIVPQLSDYAKKVSPEKRVEELVRDTKQQRVDKSVTEHFRDWLGSEDQLEASCDELGILHVTDASTRAQLVGATFLAFDMDHQLLNKYVGKRTALCPAIVFRAAAGAAQQELPFELAVLLPTPLHDKGADYADRIKERIRQAWDDALSPLISAVARLEQRTDYEAFKEALKVMLLLRDRPPEQREAFQGFERNLRHIILDIQLTDTVKARWISHKLGFRAFHDIAPTRTLTKVLAWQGTETESLLYDSSDKVRPVLHQRFDVNLPHPSEWERQVMEEWGGEDFVDNGKLAPFAKWSEERRQLYLQINDNLREKQLSFYDVGRLVFGQTRIDNLDKARAALHLFLKLGTISPLNWTITDARHDYNEMQVRSGELRQKELVEQIRNQLQLKLSDLVVAFYLAPQPARSQLVEDIQSAVNIQGQLGADKPRSVLQEWNERLGAISPSKPQKFLIDREFIQAFPSQMSKQAEFFEKLGRLLHSESALSSAVSLKVAELVKQASVDVACENLFKRIEQLHKNWGREVPFAWDADRFLVRLYLDYTSDLADIPDWHERKADECESELVGKLSNLKKRGLKKALHSICTWLDQRVAEVVKPHWEATYDQDHRQRLEQLLERSLEKATREVLTLADEVGAQLEVLDELQRNALLRRHDAEIEEYRPTLRRDLSALSQIQDRVEATAFGDVLEDIRARLSDWAQLKSEMLQSQDLIVDTWLQKHPHLLPWKEQILENVDNVSKPLVKLVRQMTDAGRDPIELLLAEELDQMLALFAAAQLLNALEMGEIQ